MVKKIVITLVSLILLLVVAYNVTLVYVDNNISQKIPDNVFNDCKKVWSSRGFYDTVAEQNSIKSVKRGQALGYQGYEIDLFYDVKTNRFIVSHDRPTKDEQGNLQYTEKEGEILTLEKLFKKTAKDTYFWLDYKNLDRISPETTAIAVKRLQVISNVDGVKERIYIEGSNPLRLSMYTDAGFKTILGMHPPYEDNILSSLGVNIFKLVYYFNNITALAMNSGSQNSLIYGPQTEKLLAGIPVFLFHIPNDEKLINYFLSKKDVRVLLIDGHKKVNRADMNSCQ